MKPENWDLFLKIEKELYHLREPERQDATIFECENHTIKEIDGLYICVHCGCVEGTALDTDGIHKENRKSFRPYEKSKHLGDLIKRISGHYYLNKNGAGPSHLILDKIPTDIKGIRKYLSKKKLNIKNDYYYWLLKNEITKKISPDHVNSWIKEFKKLRNISPRQFLYKKFLVTPGYEMFIDLFAQKKDKLINQIQSMDY